MTDYPKPDRLAADTPLSALIERYRTSLSEAPGALHAIVKVDSGSHLTEFNSDAINFLMLVGNESPQWEQNDGLRKEAREILIRRVASKLLRNRRTYQEELMIALNVAGFFAADDKNCPESENRDHDTILQFLGRFWKMYENSQGGLPRWRVLVSASLNMDYFDKIEATSEDINELYSNLYAKLEDKYREELPSYPNAIEPIGSRGTVISDSMTLLAGLVLAYSDYYRMRQRATKLLALRAEWLVNQNRELLK